MTSTAFSVAIALAALAVSALTLWLTYLRRGDLKMTQPAVIFFGNDDSDRPKVYLRTLLYSTARRGQVVEHAYVTLQRGETRQAFNIWVYGEKELARGSGLFVGESGVTVNHHFLLPQDASGFEFRSGSYRLQFHVRLVGQTENRVLADIELPLTETEAHHIRADAGGIYFDWGPESRRYHPHSHDKGDVKRFSSKEVAAMIDAMGEALKPSSGAP
jgi:hypothetical protein